MNNFLDHPEFYNRAIRTDFNKTTAEEVFKEYCSKFELASVRYHLWRCFIVAITSNSDLFDDPRDRDTLFVFISETEKVLEGVYYNNK